MAGTIEQHADSIGRDLRRVTTGLAPALRVVPGREAALLAALAREVVRLTGACASLSAEMTAARAAALSEGRAEGYAEGRTDAALLVAEALRFRKDFFDRVADEGIDLAFAAASRLVGREIERDPVIFRSCLDFWRTRACGDASCTVTLNPDDATLFWGGGAPPAGVRVQPDAAIAKGICRIEWNGGAVETGFNPAYEELRHAGS